MTQKADGPLPGTRRLLDVVARLRGEDGCPWDREQTLETLKPYLVEESYELIDAVDSGDPAKHHEELGDVLLQVALHSRIREEEGRFGFDDVANSLADKLVRRHPHVFADAVVAGTEHVLQNWERIKAEEREGEGSTLGGVPRHLPALQKAQRVQSRAARVGFDWPDATGALDKIEEEIAEIREELGTGRREAIRDEMGDLFFALVNLSRFMGDEAEETLNAATAKFTQRFEKMEQLLRESGREFEDCTLAEMEERWEVAKQQER